ncbi:MAG: hypothetical protein KF878_28625 [Planctomycetes bacterium]|nr:hypothetical protein [Planctomycetota bacterium]
MGEQRDASHSLWLLLFGTLAGLGVWRAPEVLRSQRPLEKDHAQEGAAAPWRHGSPDDPSSTNRLRLWQDPFHSLRQPDRMLADLAPVGSFHARFNRALQESANEQPLILPVFVPGGLDGEAAEQRVQTRHAVLAALHATGYVPLEQGRLQVVGIEAGRRREVDDGDDLLRRPAVIPLEWFKPVRVPRPGGDTLTRRYARILLLWVDEDALGARPLTALGACLTALVPIGTNNSTVSVVGPWSSTIFLRMLQDCPPAIGSDAGLPSGAQNHCQRLEDLTFHSPTVTATDLVLSAHLRPGRTNDRSFDGARLHVDHGPRFFRRTSPDDVLLQAIVWELELRRALPAPDGPGDGSMRHVILISEWDTLYGRALPKTFKRAMGTRQGVEFHQRTYLRGVDGLEERRSFSTEPAESSRRDAEPLTGGSQLDYLRRLGAHLDELEHRLRLTRLRVPPDRVSAVGVLGSDVYDKLLLIRALRNRFSNAIFFTTDLDVRLLDPAEYPWCRNLIIASGYGLEADPTEDVDETPRGTSRFKFEPPIFRTAHQTATYEACLQVLAVSSEANPKPMTRARLFEVSRYGAFPLATLENGQPKRIPTNEAPQSAKADETEGQTLAALLLVLAGLGLGYALLMLLFIERWWRPGRHLTNLVRAGGPPLAGAILAWVIWTDQDATGEPFAFFAGISTWPTIIVRSLGAGLAIHFLLQIRGELEAALRVLGRDLPAPLRPKPMPWPRVGLNAAGVVLIVGAALLVLSDGRKEAVLACAVFVAGCIILFCQPLNRMFRFEVDRAGPVSKAWGAYLAWSEWGGPFGRALWSAFIFIAATVPVFVIWELPSEPTRGATNSYWYRGSLAVAVLLQTTLVFCVVDVTRTCVLFMDYLYRRGPLHVDEEHPWRKSLREAYERVRSRTTDVLKPLHRRCRSVADSVLGATVRSRTTDVLKSFQRGCRFVGDFGLSCLVLACLFFPGFAMLTLVVIAVVLLYTVPRLLLAIGFGVFFAFLGAWIRDRYVTAAPPPPSERNGSDNDRLLEERRPLPQYAEVVMHLVARHTAVVGNMIYYPFILLLVMLLARLPVFDHHDWPASLIAVYCGSFGFAVACGLAMRTTAERMRRSFLELIDHEIATSRDGDEVTSLQRRREAIAAQQEGAFGPLTRNPVLRASLIPFSGLGSVQLIETLARS